jgi:hypothetical protein
VYHLALPHSRHSLSFIVNIVIVIVIHPTNMAENVLIGTSLPISIALVHEENGRVVALVPHRLRSLCWLLPRFPATAAAKALVMIDGDIPC